MSDDAITVRELPRHPDDIDAWPDTLIDGEAKYKIVNYLHELACRVMKGEVCLQLADWGMGGVVYRTPDGETCSVSTGKIRLTLLYTNEQMHGTAVATLKDKAQTGRYCETLPPLPDDYILAPSRYPSTPADSYSILDDVSRLLSNDSEAPSGRGRA